MPDPTQAPKGQRNKLLSMCLQTVGIVLLAWILSALILAPFSFSTGSLLSNGQANDFTVNDFYNLVANGRAVRSLDNDVVIVNIDQCGRPEIAALLDILSMQDPKAVGLDVIFPDEREGDEILIDAIARTPNLVMVKKLQQMGG